VRLYLLVTVRQAFSLSVAGLQHCEAARPIPGEGEQSHDLGSTCGHCVKFEKCYHGS
jgi:hypothetical protein